jgi:hypothetical protein
MKDHGLRQNARGFGKNTKMGTYCKIMLYGCAYVFAPHLVQIK